MMKNNRHLPRVDFNEPRRITKHKREALRDMLASGEVSQATHNFLGFLPFGVVERLVTRVNILAGLEGLEAEYRLNVMKAIAIASVQTKNLLEGEILDQDRQPLSPEDKDALEAFVQFTEQYLRNELKENSDVRD